MNSRAIKIFQRSVYKLSYYDKNTVIAANKKIVVRLFSDNVTYSGGQATQGQGGFYGSGGARVATSTPEHQPNATATIADIEALTAIMNVVEGLENELSTYNNTVNAKTLELKAKIKKTISNPKVKDLLNRLEMDGHPVWGLSSEERDLVRLAREKFRSS